MFVTLECVSLLIFSKIKAASEVRTKLLRTEESLWRRNPQRHFSLLPLNRLFYPALVWRWSDRF